MAAGTPVSPDATIRGANRQRASLAAQDTDGCLRELDRLAPRIGLAEVRLDLMRSFDVAKLVAGAPVPLILTCRPERERGGFTGHDSERMKILRTAHDSGCAYIDVEADCLHLVTGWGGGSPSSARRTRRRAASIVVRA